VIVGAVQLTVIAVLLIIEVLILLGAADSAFARVVTLLVIVGLLPYICEAYKLIV
jgi:hypothetical protein